LRRIKVKVIKFRIFSSYSIVNWN
jgi:hypothetical protein